MCKKKKKQRDKVIRKITPEQDAEDARRKAEKDTKSIFEKLAYIDWLGMTALVAGMTMLLVSFNVPSWGWLGVAGGITFAVISFVILGFWSWKCTHDQKKRKLKAKGFSDQNKHNRNMPSDDEIQLYDDPFQTDSDPYYIRSQSLVRRWTWDPIINFISITLRIFCYTVPRQVVGKKDRPSPLINTIYATDPRAIILSAICGINHLGFWMFKQYIPMYLEIAGKTVEETVSLLAIPTGANIVGPLVAALIATAWCVPRNESREAPKDRRKRVFRLIFMAIAFGCSMAAASGTMLVALWNHWTMVGLAAYAVIAGCYFGESRPTMCIKVCSANMLSPRRQPQCVSPHSPRDRKVHPQ